MQKGEPIWCVLLQKISYELEMRYNQSTKCTTQINTNTNLVQMYSHEFLFPGNRTGLASAAIACNEWNVDPIRNHSLVSILGALGPSGRCRMSPPALLTMKRWRNPPIIYYIIYPNPYRLGVYRCLVFMMI